MSFPPGTEMFQFPGFASISYVFRYRSPCGGVAPFGYPRIKACSRLPMAFRSVPRPSSPPDAKASTECSYRALSHRQPKPPSPCTETKHAIRNITARHRKYSHASAPLLEQNTNLILSFSTSLNVCRRGLGADTGFPMSDIRSDWLTAARPETHQNLIHNTKTNIAAQKQQSTAKPAQPHALGSQTRPGRTHTLLRRTNL